MAISRALAACAGVSMLLSGCGMTKGALIPALADESGAQGTSQTASQATSTEPEPGLAPEPSAVQSAAVAPVGVTPGAPTGTFVGHKVEELRGDLARLQAKLNADTDKLKAMQTRAVANAQTYHESVATINAKLQVGTTPGNPILVQQWNEAQAQLEQVSQDLASMNSLANDVAANGALASYLLESTRAAFGISGAVDEDHRQLTILEDEVERTIAMIDRLLNELTDNVARQTKYLTTERSNLTALALAISNGEIYGASLASRAFTPPTGPTAAPPGAGLATGRPLVVIRFDSPNVHYEQALFDAVSRALERRPTAAFDLVAVARNAGTPAETALNSSNARRNAEEVLRSLTSMGLPPDRVSLTAMTSKTARSNEVHLYVR